MWVISLEFKVKYYSIGKILIVNWAKIDSPFPFSPKKLYKNSPERQIKILSAVRNLWKSKWISDLFRSFTEMYYRTIERRNETAKGILNTRFSQKGMVYFKKTFLTTHTLVTKKACHWKDCNVRKSEFKFLQSLPRVRITRMQIIHYLVFSQW